MELDFNFLFQYDQTEIHKFYNKFAITSKNQSPENQSPFLNRNHDHKIEIDLF